MPDRTTFGHDTTTDEVLDGIDLTGRRVLITGASGGLGAETARAMAAKGASVTVTARNLEKARAAMSAVADETGNAVAVEELELDDLASIRSFAERFADDHPAVDVLINNAGVMACPQDSTRDGFELQFGTNHLGHFLLTGLLLPTLLAGDAPRIVNLSSRAHHRSAVSLDDPAFEHTEYEPWIAYGRSKTANVLHAVELDRRLASRGVHAFAVHPGTIMTDLGRHLTTEQIESMRASRPELRMKTIPAGAATSVFAATAPELAGTGGVYLEDCAVAEVDDEAPEHGVRSYALDAETAAELWSMSEQLVGQSFEL